MKTSVRNYRDGDVGKKASCGGVGTEVSARRYRDGGVEWRDRFGGVERRCRGVSERRLVELAATNGLFLPVPLGLYSPSLNKSRT